jgi:DUF4097 and DUF4098 domain-containing protein YvlB
MHSRFRPSLTAVFTLLLLCTWGVTSLQAQRANDAYQIEVFDLSTPEMTLETSGGFIEIVGSNRSTVEVQIYARKGGRYITEGNLEEVSLEVSQEGNSIRIIAESASNGWNWGNSTNISYRVYAPTFSNVTMNTSGGSLEVSGITGTIRGRTSGGSIDLNDITGTADVRTSGGAMTFTDFEGELLGRTSGGSINVRRTKGSVDVRSSGGPITITESYGGPISARTSGGSITCELMRVKGDIDLDTSGGSITIDIPLQKGYELDLKGSRVDVDMVQFTGRSERNKMVGTIMSGGPLIRASTSGGTVRLRFDE